MDPARQHETALRVVRDHESPARASQSTLEETYRRFSPYVAAIALRCSGRHDDLEDMVQDVFVEAARGIKWLRQPDAIKGWLATVTVRLVQRRLRVRRIRRFLGLDQHVDYLQVADRAASPADRVLLAEVYRLLDDLPVDDRVAWSLHHLEGEKLDAVAKLCRCSMATAKRRIARARAKIEEVVGDA